MWTPNDAKEYHPVCKAFFERGLSRQLAVDISKELSRQRAIVEMQTPIFAADEDLPAQLFECLVYVVAQLGLERRFVLNELEWD